MDIEAYKEILHRVYELAVLEGRKARESEPQSSRVGDIDLEKYREDRAKSELLKYLNTLDYDTVKVIMAVMYIGRDFEMTQEEYKDLVRKYEDEEDYDTDLEELSYPKIPIANASDTIKKYIDTISFGINQSHDIDQIYSKRLMLDRYLYRAFKILGISV